MDDDGSAQDEKTQCFKRIHKMRLYLGCWKPCDHELARDAFARYSHNSKERVVTAALTVRALADAMLCVQITPEGYCISHDGQVYETFPSVFEAVLWRNHVLAANNVIFAPNSADASHGS